MLTARSILRRASAILAIALVFACPGGAQTATTVDKSEVEIVANAAALPSCTTARNKETRWTDDEDRLYRCDGLGTWEVPSEFSEIDAVANVAALPACDASLVRRTRWTLDDGAIHRCDGVSTWETATGAVGAGTITVADEASLPVSPDTNQVAWTEDENRTFKFNGSSWIQKYDGAFTADDMLVGCAGAGICGLPSVRFSSPKFLDVGNIIRFDNQSYIATDTNSIWGQSSALLIQSLGDITLHTNGRAANFVFKFFDVSFPNTLKVSNTLSNSQPSFAILGENSAGAQSADIAYGGFFTSTGPATENVGLYAEVSTSVGATLTALWTGEGRVLIADPVSSEFVIEAGSAPTGSLLTVKDGGSSFFSVAADGSVIENGCTQFATSETPPSGSLCDEYFDTTQGPCFHNGTNFVEVGDKTTVCVV